MLFPWDCKIISHEVHKWPLHAHCCSAWWVWEFRKTNHVKLLWVFRLIMGTTCSDVFGLNPLLHAGIPDSKTVPGTLIRPTYRMEWCHSEPREEGHKSAKSKPCEPNLGQVQPTGSAERTGPFWFVRLAHRQHVDMLWPACSSDLANKC